MSKKIMVERVPGYLINGKKEKQTSRIARYGVGNEMRGGRHWEEEEGRRCRICLSIVCYRFDLF